MSSRHECGICLGDFVEPKIMPCFHTLCKVCLQNHIAATARNGEIKCPVCRKQITVPRGGAGRFTTNFYIEDRSKKNFCRKHKEMELKFYCRDCSVAICYDCIAVDHAHHTRDELKNVDRKLRKSLKDQTLAIKQKIKHLNNQLEYLDKKSKDIDVIAKTSKDNVRKKVESIITEVRQQQKEINDKIDVLQVKDSKKVGDLKAGINKDKHRLQTSVDCADKVLSDVSTIQVINILPRIKTLAKEHKPIFFCYPFVKYFNFPQTKINMDSLTELFGELHTMDSPTFKTSFNMDQMAEDHFYYSTEYMIQDLPWYVGVKHNTDYSTLGIYLYINNVKDTNVKSCTAKYTLKLINRTDDSKSISKQAIDTFTPGGSGWGRVTFIDWEDFRHLEDGFRDNDNEFKVQATVEISKICFTSCFDLKRVDTDTHYSNNRLVMFQDLYWRVAVKHHLTKSTLGVYLILEAEREKNLTSCTASHTFKLVHVLNDSKSKEITMDDTSYTPGGSGYGTSNCINWNTLQNERNGFLEGGLIRPGGFLEGGLIRLGDFLEGVTILHSIANAFSTIINMVRSPSVHFTIETTIEVTSSTFTDTFNLIDVPTDISYRGTIRTIQYLPWCISVKHRTDTKSLGLYLELHPCHDKTVKTCLAKYELKLVHPTDQSQSVKGEFEYTFKPNRIGYGMPKFIDWDDLTRRFIDGKMFTVQATITITDVGRQ